MTSLAPPQEPVPPAPRVRRRGSLGNRRRLTVAIVVLVAAFGFLLYRGLGNAALYFRTADEAVAQKATLGTHQFRIEGTVVAGTIRTVAQTVDFQIVGPGGTRVAVVHTGDQPQLFKDSTPVVLEGHWAGDHFASDQIMIKHSADYKTQHPDRLSGTNQ
ncbi:MAG: cytochrome c maturation protein CcmE [Acidimicrobiales bacterium]